MRTSFRYILALGSNEGNRRDHLRFAHRGLSAFSRILASSGVIETAPMRHPLYHAEDHGPYLNEMLEVASPLGPAEFYRHSAWLEDIAGHNRAQRWRPRGLDIDIVLAAWDNPKLPFERCSPLHTLPQHFLRIPHPGVFERDFWKDLMVSLGMRIKTSELMLQ